MEHAMIITSQLKKKKKIGPAGFKRRRKLVTEKPLALRFLSAPLLTLANISLQTEQKNPLCIANSVWTMFCNYLDIFSCCYLM